MRISPVDLAGSDIADRLATSASTDGSAAHPAPAALLTRKSTTRDLADATHFLCMLHGRHPGLAELALERAALSPAGDWLKRTSAGFAAERLYITKLVVAVGPLPSTLRQTECEAAVIGQHHALSMLARSDRMGTALGAAFALALDWVAVRAVLDAAARRCGVAVEPTLIPDAIATHAAITAAAGDPAVARAIGFGASQLFVQHRGLWDLLESRQAARIDQ
ncbi:hypothetical protein ABC347_04270 [Sphingomonas sp. 1P06PA]|uniref:DUF6975 family protein n=1 Tax=Sphingomonas sp. 1P06PA TaxID=554121 RepID=UPI0039A4DECF